ncbi:MAG: hypothetical protein MZV65_40550 [Chromatiales bacterium]|nr:hypothetical protein [Chromatiales bacterium]
MKTTPPTTPTPDDAALWHDGRLYLADQRILPERAEFLSYDRAAEVATAIRDMVVRGAPAIGVAAAYGVALAGREAAARRGRKLEAGDRSRSGATGRLASDRRQSVLGDPAHAGA